EVNNFMVKRQCIGTPNIPTEDDPSTPDTPDTPTGAVFSESFATGLGAFTEEFVNLPEGLTYIFSWYEQAKCAKASGFANSKAYDTEAYLVSPAFAVPAAGATVTFEHATNYFASTETARAETGLYIREEGTTTWTPLTVPDYPTSQSWSFVSSGDIDIKAWAGKRVQLGFRYSSTSAKAGTWEFKTLVVK
ncbi:MAG: choice-of-anchor J domain-containing protein, partial [Duncaniella sp.]|nr:choice-of-anchor J domain-containing protein [Duncaniella sp.]